MFNFVKCAICSPKNPFTETDGSWCLKRIMGTIAAVEMIYKFYHLTGTPDFVNFATGLSLIIGALAVANYAEKGDKKPEAPHA